MWSRKFERCVRCGTTNTKHIAKGLCKTCYAQNSEEKHKIQIGQKRGIADEILTKKKLIELYIEKEMSLAEIGKYAGCTRGNVYSKLKKFGIEARSKSTARTLALDKGKIKTTKIDEFGVIEEVIFHKIRYNKGFFKAWSDEMAYVLGLLFTDGNLHIRKDQSGYELCVLSFAQKEKELVEKILILLECDAKIRYRKRKEFENTTAGELYYFSIGNNELGNDLLKLGLTPNKSLSMNFPEIPNEYLRHFVRGFFDGDGSVYLESNKSIRIKLLSGSRNFIITLNDKLVENGFSNRTINGGTLSTPNSYFIRYNSNFEALKFYEFLFKDVPDRMLYLRKRKVFEDYFKIR